MNNPTVNSEPTVEEARTFELEHHADGTVYVVDPSPDLRDPVNGNFAVVAKCKSTSEARQQIRKLKGLHR